MLYRLVAVTAAGMFALGALHAPSEVAPRPDARLTEAAAEPAGAPGHRAIEVGRSAITALGLSFSGAEAVNRTGPSEAEAIAIALARGEEIKAAREGRAPAPAPDAPEAATITLASAPAAAEPRPADPATPRWIVTGSTVNLRAGPGTNHAVVGQAREGDLARPVGDTGGDWIRIELADSGAEAWIFARFLAPAEG